MPPQTPQFNNGQPLSPKQIQDIRSSAGISSVSNPSSTGSQGINPRANQSVKSASIETAPEEKGIIPQAVDTFKEGFKQTQEGAKNPDLLQGLQQIGRGTLNEMGASLRAVFSPVEAGLKIVSQLPGFHQALGALQDHVIDPAANKISDSPAIQKFMQSNPHADEVFGNLVSIVGALAGSKKMPEIKSAIETGTEGAISKIKDVAGTTKEMAGDAMGKVKSTVGMGEKTPAQIQADLESKAVKDATPSYNKSLIGEPAIKGENGVNTPRVSEVDSKNPFKMRTVNPTASEVEAGKELSKVKGYDSKASSLDKYNTVANDIGSKSKAYRTSLASEKVVIPKKEMVSLVRKTVNETSQNSVLLQKTDPIVKNYIRVATRAAQKVEGTLAGEDDLRLALDRAYEDAGGKYGNNKGLDQIHRAARNAITKDMETKAQTTQVKASLKQMTNLYRASDVLKDKAQAEGGSKWEQFKKAHPIITKAGKAGARMIGIGEAAHFVP